MTLLDQTYVFACAAGDVPFGEGRTALAGGTRVAIFNTAEGWRAVEAACTHRAGPLADGIVADSSVTCPLHLRRFDLRTGEALGHECPALRVYDVEVRGDEVFVAV